MKAVAMTIVLLAILVGSAAMAQGYEPPIGGYTWEGYVKNSADQKPVSGVPVNVSAVYRTHTYWETEPGEWTGWFETGTTPTTNAQGFYVSPNYEAVVGPFQVEREIEGYIEYGTQIQYFHHFDLELYTPHLTYVSENANTMYVRPTNSFTNTVEIPLSYINRQIKHGFQQLNKYLHQVSSGGYTLSCGQPVVSLNPGTGKATFTFSVNAKQGSTNLGTYNASITCPATANGLNDGLALDLKWVLNDLTFPSGAFGTHQSAVRSIINQYLEHDLYLAPATFSGTLITIPSISTSLWNSTQLNSVTITSSAIQININTGWYVY